MRNNEFFNSLKVETPNMYLSKKLKEKGLKLENFKGNSLNMLMNTITGGLSPFGWYSEQIDSSRKDEIDKRLEDITISEDGNEIVVNEKNEGEIGETTMTFDEAQGLIKMAQKGAKVIVEQMQNGKFMQRDTALSKTMYMDKEGRTMQVDCESLDMTVETYSNPEQLMEPKFLEEFKKFEGMEPFISKMSAKGKELQYMGPDGKLITTELTPEIANAMQMCFNTTKGSPIKVAEEQLEKIEQQKEQEQNGMEIE